MNIVRELTDGVGRAMAPASAPLPVAMLQSSRLEKCRKFQTGDALQRKCCQALPLFVFRQGHSYSLSRDTKGRFYFPFRIQTASGDTERGPARPPPVNANPGPEKERMSMKYKELVIALSVLGCPIFAVAQEVTAAKADSAPAREAEVKAEPGAVLMVWKGKDTTKPELAAMIDKQKAFSVRNAENDPSVGMLHHKTCCWTGILNIEEPGSYIFNVVYNAPTKGSVFALSINGTQIARFEGTSTDSIEVQLPGSVNIAITLYQDHYSHDRDRVIIRYKKKGALGYAAIGPETLYHAVK